MLVRAVASGASAVTLQVGVTLGPYRIAGLLGTGGMGEVYRARDTRLDRDVAIKALPVEFGADSERLATFDREAKMLASLNHPYIGAIYGIEESEGAKYLVLEYVSGKSLHEVLHGLPHARSAISVPAAATDRSRRVATQPGGHTAAHGVSAGGTPRRRLTLEESLALGRELCSALEAAHERGIVHRDVKPANIMITGTGQVKVLDFGIASAVNAQARHGDEGAPTMTALGTQLGMVSALPRTCRPSRPKTRDRQAHRYLGVRLRAVRDARRQAGVRSRRPGRNNRRHRQR